MIDGKNRSHAGDTTATAFGVSALWQGLGKVLNLYDLVSPAGHAP